MTCFVLCIQYVWFSESPKVCWADLKSNCINRTFHSETSTNEFLADLLFLKKNSHWICCPVGTNYTPFWLISSNSFYFSLLSLSFSLLPRNKTSEELKIISTQVMKTVRWSRSGRLIKIFSLAWCETNRKLLSWILFDV